MSEEIIQNVSSQLLSYPSNGSRKIGAKAGKYVLDFANGLVVSPDGVTETMSKSLSQLGAQFVKSCFITVSSVDVKIKIGQNTLPKGHQLTYVINGIAFDTMEIIFPNDRTPLNDFSFAVIGSDSQVFPISTDNLTGFHTPTSKTGNTVDTDTTIIDFLFTGFSQNEIIIENTGGSNTMVATVEVSQDGINFVAHQSYPSDVLPNDFNVFASSVSHRYLRVRLKAKVASSQTTYRVQLNLER